MRRVLCTFLVIAWCVPAAYAQDAAPVVLTPEDAIARAIAHSQRLAEAEARKEGAQAAVESRRAAERPSLGVSAGYTRTNHVDQFFVPQPIGLPRLIYPDIPDNLFTRATLQWPIYTAGRLDALVRAAEAETLAADADLRTARADLRLEVVRAYWALVTATESARVFEDALTRADAHLGDVRSRFENGLVPPNEVAAVEAQRARQQMQLIDARNLRESVLEDLRRLTGITADITVQRFPDSSQKVFTPVRYGGPPRWFTRDSTRRFCPPIRTGSARRASRGGRPACRGRAGGSKPHRVIHGRRRLRESEPEDLSARGQLAHIVGTRGRRRLDAVGWRAGGGRISGSGGGGARAPRPARRLERAHRDRDSTTATRSRLGARRSRRGRRGGPQRRRSPPHRQRALQCRRRDQHRSARCAVGAPAGRARSDPRARQHPTRRSAAGPRRGLRALGMAAIEVHELTRRFGAFTAVDRLSFDVQPGEIFGFLGANGAGKSTTIRMLCGLLRPTSGTALVGGVDVSKDPEGVKRRIGYMSQRFSLYERLTIDQNIQFFGGIYGLRGRTFEERRAFVLEMAGLEGREHSRTSELAGGWRQRLALGCAILHQPPIVFLDEPTGGVDPLSRRQFWDLIGALSQSGTTVLVTTHYLDEAEHCHRLAIIHAGRSPRSGRPPRSRNASVPVRSSKSSPPIRSP